MKKLYLFIFFLFLSNFCNSQIKNGFILYGVISNTDVLDEMNLDKNTSEMMKKTIKNSEVVEYSLNFNATESYYFANPILEDEKTTLNGMVTIGGGKLKYYQNNSTNEYREFIDYTRTGPAILNKQTLCEWTLTNDFKTIDGRKCLKATSPQFKKNGEKTLEHKFDIIAWYTPEIPVSYGPNGYGGLPGLILELQHPMSTFYAKKINLNLEKEPTIDKLTSMKAISEEELNARAMSTMSKDRLEMIKEADAKNKEEKK